MNIKDFQDSLEYMFKAQVTAFVWGHAGIGKSSIIKQYAARKGYHFFPMYLGTQSDLGDILGLADFKRDENGTAVATTFATPVWLKDAIDYCNNNPESGAIIFLDEFNRARRDVLNGMFSLALDKTFHTIKLPENCHIIAAGNPPTDEYYVTDVNETALMSRFVHIKLEPTVEEWMKYAKDKQVESTLISFLQEQPGLLEDAKSSFNLPVKVDRRSYERLDKLFKLSTPPDLLNQLMQGIIGIERTVAYQLHCQKAAKPLSALEVLLGEKTDLIKTWSDPVNVKSSLINGTCDNVIERLNQHDAEGSLLTETQSANLLAFMESIPKDIAFPLLQTLIKNENKAFKTFCDIPHIQAKLVKLVREVRDIEVNVADAV